MNENDRSLPREAAVTAVNTASATAGVLTGVYVGLLVINKLASLKKKFTSKPETPES